MRSAQVLPLIAAAALSLTGLTAVGQGYPERPIRMVVPYPPGGAADLLGRALAQKLSENLNQQVIVDNRGGGGQVIATDIVANAAPDGYTILMASVTHSINPGLQPKLPYDTQKDFAPISFLGSSPLVLVVHPSVQARSVKELLALAKSKPDQLNYASAGNGSGGHLAMALLLDMSGTTMVHVPYKGAGPALIDLIAGQVQAQMTSPLAALPHAKAGKLRLLAVSGKSRSPALPETPTIAETVPDYEASLWYGFLAPAGTPQTAIARLNAAAQKALSDAEVRALYAKYGAEPAGSTPEEFARHIAAEIAKWRKVIKAAGIRTG